MDYKDKLRAWNSTDKYKSEVAFLKQLIPRLPWMNTLDYGAGLCLTASEMFADAFDVYDYKEYDVYEYYLNELPDKIYRHIYFMHSIAHIKNPIEVLKQIKLKYPQAIITVITPNTYWLLMQNNNNYKPDDTVVAHYTQSQLSELFKEAGYNVTICGQFGAETSGVNERIFLQAI